MTKANYLLQNTATHTKKKLTFKTLKQLHSKIVNHLLTLHLAPTKRTLSQSVHFFKSHKLLTIVKIIQGVEIYVITAVMTYMENKITA